MQLTDLITGVDDALVIGDGRTEVLGLSADSRTVAPGTLFAAIAGTRTNGLDYLPTALLAGASVVLCHQPLKDCPVPQVVTKNPRLVFAQLADRFYGCPSKYLTLIGITGTNGKTTTAFILQHILNNNGIRCGLIGTVACDCGQGLIPSEMTTPDSVDFYAMLATMVQNGCGAAAVEVSSHALDQYRVGDARFSAAVFTNLTRDHLDYHGDMESYAGAKARLFSGLSAHSHAIINADDPYEVTMAEATGAKVTTYGCEEGADLRAELVSMDINSTKIKIQSGESTAECSTYLIGLFNVHNLLAAICSALRLGVSLDGCLKAAQSFKGVPGRLERVDGRSVCHVFVDYAHTDDALRNVLSVLRPLAKAQLIVVFGCGGDRDRGKRPLMARAVESLADVVFLTSDNPRTEDPDQIFADIRPGFFCPEKVIVEPDRRTAITMAITNAGPDDIVLLAGKGHEDYQVIGTEKKHFDDRECAAQVLTEVQQARENV